MRTVCSKEVRERLFYKGDPWRQSVLYGGGLRIFWGREGSGKTSDVRGVDAGFAGL